MSRCHSSIPATSMRPPPATPALLTRPSRPPQRSSTQARALAQSSSEVMSSFTVVEEGALALLGRQVGSSRLVGGSPPSALWRR